MTRIAPGIAEDVAEVLRGFGVAEDVIVQAISEGDLKTALSDTVAARSGASRTVTPAEVEATCGMPLEPRA